MKTAVSLFVIVGSLLTGIHDASASSITSAISVETTMGRASSINDISNIINQRGLVTIDSTTQAITPYTYVSGVTNFDDYINSAVIHNWFGIDDPSDGVVLDEQVFGEWFAGKNSAGQYYSTGSITFDLGTNYILDRLVLWNEDSVGIKDIEIFTSTDKKNWTFNTLVAGLDDNLINTNYGEQVITLATISIARYVKIDVLSSYDIAGTNPIKAQASIGEIAFSTNPVPEPATLLLLGTGLVGLLGARRIKK